jgi:hypothetical protein
MDKDLICDISQEMMGSQHVLEKNNKLSMSSQVEETPHLQAM